MDVEVNYLAVVLAAISTMVVGMIWYAKPVFGNIWQTKLGLTDDDLKKGMPEAMATGIIGALFKAYVLAHVTFLAHNFFGNSFMQDAITTSIWVWLGFVASSIAIKNGYERTSRTLTAVAVGGELVTFLVMGLIIGVFGI